MAAPACQHPPCPWWDVHQPNHHTGTQKNILECLDFFWFFFFAVFNECCSVNFTADKLKIFNNSHTAVASLRFCSGLSFNTHVNYKYMGDFHDQMWSCARLRAVATLGKYLSLCTSLVLYCFQPLLHMHSVILSITATTTANLWAALMPWQVGPAADQCQSPSNGLDMPKHSFSIKISGNSSKHGQFAQTSPSMAIADLSYLQDLRFPYLARSSPIGHVCCCCRWFWYPEFCCNCWLTSETYTAEKPIFKSGLQTTKLDLQTQKDSDFQTQQPQACCAYTGCASVCWA